MRKVWRQLRREGCDAGRDRVGRLMAELGLCGATRTKTVLTTRPAPESQRPADLVDRMITATAPDRLWVADLTYVAVGSFRWVINRMHRIVWAGVGREHDRRTATSDDGRRWR